MARATTAALGSLLLYSLDLAQRDYDVMRLRGYEGRLRVPLPRSRVARARRGAARGRVPSRSRSSVAWRVGWQTLNPYSWLLPLPALALLGVAVVTRTTDQEVDR